MKPFSTHGSGQFNKSQFKRIGENVIFEPGVLVFHPETISIGDNVYIGHNTILKGYYKNEFIIGSNVWMGQQCFAHSAAGIVIEDSVGIGPAVKILTSQHSLTGEQKPIMENELEFSPILIQKGSDIGVGSILLPGITIGSYAQVAAGAVVTRDVATSSVVRGVPAK